MIYIDKHFSNLLNSQWERLEEKCGSGKKKRNKKYRRRDTKNKKKKG